MPRSRPSTKGWRRDEQNGYHSTVENHCSLSGRSRRTNLDLYLLRGERSEGPMKPETTNSGVCGEFAWITRLQARCYA